MTMIIFYEKPGCANNARQKQLLRNAGYKIETRDLLAYQWMHNELRDFFGQRPVQEWFNPASPRIKSGEIEPTQYTEQQAIEFMLGDPLLIRRPLIEYLGKKIAGFDATILENQLGISVDIREDVTTCRAKSGR